jgi:hypothetical protein
VNERFANSIAAALVLFAVNGCIAASDESAVENDGSSVLALEDGVGDIAKVVDWDSGARNLTVVNRALSTELLRQNMGTVGGYEDPDELPPGPCRNIAIRWNVFVWQERSDVWFRELLRESARFECGVRFVRSEVRNEDGSFDLFELRPAPVE